MQALVAVLILVVVVAVLLLVLAKRLADRVKAMRAETDRIEAIAAEHRAAAERAQR